MASNLIVIPPVPSGRKGVDYTIHYPSLASDNEFIPVACLTTGDVITVGNNKDLEYTLPHLSANRITSTRLYAHFCNSFFANTTTWCRYLSHNNVNGKYYVESGRIFFKDSNNVIHPLIVMAVRKSQLFKVNKSSPDPSQFCIIVDNSFINNPDHFKVYRNVKKYLIDMIAPKLDIIYTNSLMKLCFNSSLSLPKFDKLTDMIEHNNSINDILLKAIKT